MKRLFCFYMYYLLEVIIYYIIKTVSKCGDYVINTEHITTKLLLLFTTKRCYLTVYHYMFQNKSHVLRSMLQWCYNFMYVPLDPHIGIFSRACGQSVKKKQYFAQITPASYYYITKLFQSKFLSHIVPFRRYLTLH